MVNSPRPIPIVTNLLRFVSLSKATFVVISARTFNCVYKKLISNTESQALETNCKIGQPLNLKYHLAN